MLGLNFSRYPETQQEEYFISAYYGKIRQETSDSKCSVLNVSKDHYLIYVQLSEVDKQL